MDSQDNIIVADWGNSRIQVSSQHRDWGNFRILVSAQYGSTEAQTLVLFTQDSYHGKLSRLGNSMMQLHIITIVQYTYTHCTYYTNCSGEWEQFQHKDYYCKAQLVYQ